MTERTQGWLIIQRSMADPHDTVWNHPSPFDVRSARLDLLFLARFKASPYVTVRGVDDLQRGEFVAALRYLARRWRWTKSKVERFLKKCVSDEFISRQRPGRTGDVYLVVNYEFYQDPLRVSGRETGRMRDTSETKENTCNTSTTSLVRKNPSRRPRPPLTNGAALIGFARCWSIYPRRKGSNSKGKAEAAYLARVRQGVSEDHLLACTQRYRRWCDVNRKTGTEFVMMPATFFGPDRRYDDDAWAEDDGRDDVPSSIPGAEDENDARALRKLGY